MAEISILNKEDFLKILQDRFKIKNVEYVNHKWSGISENVEGFLGQHYILTLTYKIGKIESTDSFFIKTRPMETGTQTEMIDELNAYGKEIFLYDFLFKEFEKLGYYTSFAPKSYYCKKDKTIVLEDLREKGFTVFPKRDFYDEDHCKICLQSLAYYHANTLAFEEEQSKQLGRPYRLTDDHGEVLKEVFLNPEILDGTGTKFISSSIDCFMKSFEEISKPKEWIEEFEKKINSYNFRQVFNSSLPYRKTTCHGDLWSNNMMFMYANNVPIHSCLLDFQILRYHYSAYDVLLFIYTNTRKEFRKQHFKTLLDYYYTTFEDILQSYGYEASKILSKQDFMECCNVLEPIAMMQAFSAETFTYLPDEVASNVVNGEDKEALEDYFYKDRPSLVLKTIKKDKLFRELMVDNINDLYDIL